MIKIGFKEHYRVLHFTTEIGNYMNGGLTTFINEQYKYHSNDVGFVHCYHPKIFSEISIENYPGSKDIASFSMLEPEQLAELSFDIAVFHYYGYDFIVEEALRRKKAIVYVIHALVTPEPYNVKNPYDFSVDGFPYYPFGDQKEFFLKYPFENSCEKANMLVCVSHAEQQKLASFYPKWGNKIKVVHNGITINESSSVEYSIRPERNVFGYIGRIEHRKGLLECIKAFDSIEAKFRIACAINFPSYFRALKNYISAADMDKKIQFYGWCQGERRKSFLQSLDALIVPSLYEAFGYVVLEAMEAKIPVICSNCGGIPEIVGSYKYCFDPYQAGDLQKCIRQFQTDSVATIQSEVAALCSRLKLFSSEKMVNQYLDLYNSIV